MSQECKYKYPNIKEMKKKKIIIIIIIIIEISPWDFLVAEVVK